MKNGSPLRKPRTCSEPLHCSEDGTLGGGGPTSALFFPHAQAISALARHRLNHAPPFFQHARTTRGRTGPSRAPPRVPEGGFRDAVGAVGGAKALGQPGARLAAARPSSMSFRNGTKFRPASRLHRMPGGQQHVEAETFPYAAKGFSASDPSAQFPPPHRKIARPSRAR